MRCRSCALSAAARAKSFSEESCGVADVSKRPDVPGTTRGVLKSGNCDAKSLTHAGQRLSHPVPPSKVLRMNSSLNEPAQAVSAWVKTLRAEIAGVIVGQEQLVDRLLVGLLANGHVLLEGVPGLAKTMSVRTLASAIHATFHRI